MNCRTFTGLMVAILSATLSAAAVPSRPAAERPRIAVKVENTSAVERAAGPVTFAMVLAEGGVPSTVAIEKLATQVDVKRRWPDGSLKHAVITVALPKLPAKGSRELILKPVERVDEKTAVPPEIASALKQLEDLKVKLEIHNEPRRSVSLKKLIAEGRPVRVWLAGEQVVEYHYRAAPTDEKGKPDPDLEVRFRVRYYPAAKSARVALVVENCHWQSPGNVPYDVQVLVGGKEVYACPGAGVWPSQEAGGKYADYLGHPRGARWVKRFWLGRRLDEVHVGYDAAYLCGTGLLPRYDSALKVPEEELEKMAAHWREKAATDILQRGTIMAYFPTTGGRADIGPLPRWTARYLISQDPRARLVTWGNADLSGSCPVHLRDAKTDWFINLDEHPTYSHNPRGTRERVKPRDITDTPWVKAPRSYFSVDAAHQPSLAYVPYLMTGDYYYLEEMGFWAAHNMVTIHYQYRQQEKGLLTPNQVRGVAWTLRNLVHVAALAPDASREQAYFEAKLHNNLKYLSDFATGPDASPLGIYKLGATHAYTRGWPSEWRNRYYSMPGWQHNFLAWVAAHAVDHGYQEAAPFRDYVMKFTIGLLAHPDEVTPFAGTAYFVFVGERFKDKPTRWCRSWKEVSDLTYKAPGFEPRKLPTAVSYPGFGGSYSYIARGVLIEALRVGHPDSEKAKSALKWLESHLPNRQQVMSANPKWAFSVPEGN